VFRTGLYSGNIFLPRNEKSGPGQTFKQHTENSRSQILFMVGGATKGKMKRRIIFKIKRTQNESVIKKYSSK